MHAIIVAYTGADQLLQLFFFQQELKEDLASCGGVAYFYCAIDMHLFARPTEAHNEFKIGYGNNICATKYKEDCRKKVGRHR